THPTLSGWSHFNDDEWELYHTEVDRSELHNLAADHPDKLRELVNLWFSESQSVNIRGRSFVIGALVDLPVAGAEGVLFAQGSRFGGHALYIKDNRLHYVNNVVGTNEQLLQATEDLPTGDGLILSASFERDGEDDRHMTTGILTLFHD